MTTWLFRRFIVRRWFRNPVRPVLMLAAVVLATTLWSAVLRATFSGVRSFERSLGISDSDLPLIMAPQGGRLLMSDVGPCLSGISSAFDVVAIRREGARLVSSHGARPTRVVGVGGYGALLRESEGGIGDAAIFQIAPELARSSGLTENESVSLDFDGSLLEGRVQVAGAGRAEAASASVSVALTLLQRVSPAGAIDIVLLKPHAAAVSPAMREELSRWFEGCYRGVVPLRIETSRERVEHGEGLLGAYRFNVLVMAAMTLVVCVLLVSQATHASLLTLSRELSILRTLGIGRAACLIAVVVEAALLGTIGAVLGITLGYPLTLEISSFLLGTAAEIYKLEMEGLRGTGLLLSELGVVVTIICVAILGALIGGVQALRVSPNVGTRREFVHIRPIARSVVVGSALLVFLIFVGALGVVLVFPTLWGSYFFVLACVALVIGVTPLGLSITQGLTRFCGSSLVPRLAAGGVRLSGRGYLLAAMGAAVAITLISALTLMVGSFRTTLKSWADTRLQGDLFVSSVVEGDGNEGRLSRSFVGDVGTLDGVQEAVPYYEAQTRIGEHAVVVGGTDLPTQATRGVYRLVDGSLDVAALAERRACLISESAARTFRVGPGATVKVENTACAVQAVLQEFGTERPMVLIDDDAFLALYPGHAPQSLIVYLRDRGSVEDVRMAIEARGRGGVVVRDQRELKELVMYLFDRTFRVTESVRWIVFGIGVLGLVVAALQLFWERRREVKTLIVIGGSPAQAIGWSLVEGILVSIGPLVLGVLMGSIVGWALTTLINPLSFGWTLEFTMSAAPLVCAGGFVVCVMVVLLPACSLAARRVVKRTTLSDE